MSFQDKLEEICTPKIFIDERGSIELSSNKIWGSEEFVEREIGRNCVLEALTLTKFWVPHSDIFSRSEAIFDAMNVWESEQSAREQGK